MSFQKVICWEEEAVPRMIDTEALQTVMPIFLATHSPAKMRRVTGTSTTGPLITQAEFLSEFLSRNRSHMQAMILGTAGSGKSHLVRWLWASIPQSASVRVVMIPKVHTNLKRVIELVLDGMEGPAFDDYRRRLSMATAELHPESARQVFITMLRIATGPRGPHSEEQLRDPDQQELREYLIENVPILLEEPAVKTRLIQDGGIVARLMEHALGETRLERREVPHCFSETDIPLDMMVGDLSTKARQVYGELRSDRERLVPAMADWLNLNLDYAFEKLLQFSGDDLNQLMLDVRETLAGQGKELILLIEDFAKLQGIDQGLLEALLVRPVQGDRHLCVLRSAMAVTAGYYRERIPQTVRDRVDLAVDLDVRGTGERRDVTAQDIAGFTARYLNASRLGEQEIRDWYDRRGRGEEEEELPNACTPCQYRHECHAAFGSVKVDGTGEGRENIGLYPFTEDSLDRMFARMSQSERELQNSFNPRLLLNRVVKETLEEAGVSLEQGLFPRGALLVSFGGADPRLPAGERDTLRAEVGRGLFEQYLAIFSLWGEGNHLRGVSDAIFDAFGLRVPRPVTGPEPVPVPQPDPKVDPKPTPGLPARLQAALQGLDRWSNQQRIDQDTAQVVREILFPAIISTIQWDTEMLARSFHVGAQRPFQRTSLQFQGQQTTPGRPSLVLKFPLDGEFTRCALTLQGVLLYQHHGHWRFHDGADRLVTYAEFLQQAAVEVVTQLRQLPTEAELWDPAPAAVELLALGARMAGTASSASIEQRVDALFRDWTTAAMAPDSPRSKSWRMLARFFEQRGNDLVEILVSQIGCTKGGGLKAQIIQPAPVLKILRARGEVIGVEHPAPSGIRESYKYLRTGQERIAENLSAAIGEETQRYLSWFRDVRQEIAPDTKAELLQTLRQTARQADTDGVRGEARTDQTEIFNRFLLAFQQCGFERCMETLEHLEEEQTEGGKLDLLGRPETLEVMKITDGFLNRASSFLKATEQRVEDQIEDLTVLTGDVGGTQRQIGESLDQLLALTAIAGDVPPPPEESGATEAEDAA